MHCYYKFYLHCPMLLCYSRGLIEVGEKRFALDVMNCATGMSYSASVGSTHSLHSMCNFVIVFVFTVSRTAYIRVHVD